MLGFILLAGAPAVSVTPAPPMVKREILATAMPNLEKKVAPGPHCTHSKQWCFNLVLDQKDGATSPRVEVRHAISGIGSVPVDLPDRDIILWDEAFSYRSESGRDAIVFGLRSYRTEGYSGGGAGVGALKLVRAEVADNGEISVVPLEDWIPFGGSALIRACFSEADMKLRRGVCHDEYELDVDIRANGKLSRGMPELLYISEATVSPGFASRDQDNSDHTFLRKRTKRDFLPRTDQRCTFTRILRVDPERTTYVLDAPDCSEFTGGWE